MLLSAGAKADASGPGGFSALVAASEPRYSRHGSTGMWIALGLSRAKHEDNSHPCSPLEIREMAVSRGEATCRGRGDE